MQSLSDYLTHDHEHCDDLFAEAENAVASGDWANGGKYYAEFMQATLRHFAREESVLFPEFEQRTGMVGGPTEVMRSEHDQMRNAMEGMAATLSRRDSNAFLGLSETLLMLLRQHNLKEERILYPMLDRALSSPAELLQRMDKVVG